MLEQAVLRSIEKLNLGKSGELWLLAVTEAQELGKYLDADKLMIYAAKVMSYAEHFKLLAAALAHTGAEKWTDLSVFEEGPGFRVFVGNNHPPVYLDTRKGGRPLESTDRLSFAADVENMSQAAGTEEAEKQRVRFMSM